MRRLVIWLTLVAASVAGSDEIRPADNLVLQNIPPVPASLAYDVARYTQGRAAEILTWHPRKREMLIATWFCDTSQVFQVKFPGAARTQLTFGQERPTRGVSYEPVNGDYFIFIRDQNGDQKFQIYRHDMDTRREALLTDGTSKNSAGTWSNAGDRIVYGSTKRNGRDVDFYVMNPRDPGTDRLLIALEGSGWSALEWSPDDKKIVAVEEISINEKYLWMIDVATGTKELLTPKTGPRAYYGEAHFVPGGKGLYVVTDRESEFLRLAHFDPATQRYRSIGKYSRSDVVEFEPSPDGKLLATVSNDDGLTTLHLLNAASGKEIPLKNMPSGSVIDIHWQKSSRYLGFSLDSARTNTDAYSLDVKTGTVERWTYSEVGEVNTKEFSEPELIRWKGADQLPLSGFLYRPPARFRGKRPVIIDIHGGPESQFQPYPLGPENYYLNELGVALLFPNIRGSSGYGKTFLTLDNGMLRENAYDDIGALLDWIKTHPDLDSERIMVRGFSYGGNVALVTATRYPDRIRCAVDIVGPSNLVTFLERTADWRRDLRRAEYGDERDPKVRAFLERIAPVKNATKITKPLLVVQGLNDPAVAPAEAEQMISAVRANGVPVWYLAAKDEGHGFSKKTNRDFLFYVTVLFVQKFLLN